MIIKSTIGIVFLCLLSLSTKAQEDSQYTLDKIYQLDQNGTVHLRTEDADVRITGSDRKDVRVVVERYEQIRGASSRRSFEMEIEEKSGDLFIKERKRTNNWTVGYYRLDYEITIEMPKNGSLRIDGEDDNYLIQSVDGSIQISTEDGDVEIIDCHGDDFEIEMEDGDLELDGGTGSLYISMDDGDADVTRGKFNDVEIRIEDGNIILETALDDQGRYGMDGDDADMELVVLSGGGDFNISKDDARVSASSDFDLVRETDYRVEYKLGAGKAEVSIKTNDGRVRLVKD